MYEDMQQEPVYCTAGALIKDLKSSQCIQKVPLALHLLLVVIVY